MPLEGRAKSVMRDMKDRYGDEDGERVFYATANKQGRKHETWKKESSDCLTGPLKAALNKRAAAATPPVDPLDARAFYREETQHTKLASDSILGQALRGALAGGLAGAGAYGGYGAYTGSRSYGKAAPHYDQMFQLLKQDTQGIPDQAKILQEAADRAPTRSGAMWREGTPRALTGGLVGAGAGAAVNILRHALRGRRPTVDPQAEALMEELQHRRERARQRSRRQHLQQLGVE